MAVTWHSVVYRLFLIELVLGMRFYVWFKCHEFMSVLRCACVNVCTRSNRNGNKEDKIILKLQLLHRRLLFYRYFNGLVVIKFGACVRFKFSFFSSLFFSIRRTHSCTSAVFHAVFDLSIAQWDDDMMLTGLHACIDWCMEWILLGNITIKSDKNK